MVHDSPALTNRSAKQVARVDGTPQRVDALRIAISQDVHELRRRVRETFDLRRQAAKHPFVAAAVVLGGVVVVTGIAQSWYRGGRARRAEVPGRRHSWVDIAVEYALGRGAGAREARRRTTAR